MLQEKCWLWKQRVYPGYGLLVYHIILVSWHPSRKYNLIRSWNNEALSVERRRNILFSGHTLFGLKCHTSTLTFQTKTHSAWVYTARIVKRHEAWSLGMGEGNKNSILFRSWCHQKWRLAQIATKSFGKEPQLSQLHFVIFFDRSLRFGHAGG